MIDAVLAAAGRRTGLYTSPHLVDLTERIRVQGRTIPREAVVALARELREDLAAGGIGLTYFEFVTLLGFEWFARVGVEVAVVEVGLGGRLDATNLVHPVVTAITTIARDHEDFLGHDLGAIAAEKAGIVKAGVPLALGRVPPEAEEAIVSRARALGAPLARVGVDGVLTGEADGALAFRGPGVAWDGLRLGLPGRFQRDNMAVALTALALARDVVPCSPAAVRVGLAAVRWPGRLAVVGDTPLLVLDGAHNPAGVAALVPELPALVGRRPLVLVFAVMADKAWEAMLAPLLPSVARVVVTRVGRRAAVPAAVAATLEGRVPVEVVEDARLALRVARTAAGPGGAVLVTGSLFLVGEAYAELAGPAGPSLFDAWHGSEVDGTRATP
jgi:dihydrofolate synthase/folylpolyglutamate synthase